MKKLFLMAGVALISAHSFAQTVTVNGTLSAPTTYDTLTNALLSFHTGGPNTGNVAPNVIEITTFGPHDVRVPVLGSGAVTLTGAAVQVIDGTEGFTISGVGITPLILVQNNEVSSGDGIVIQNAAANVFNDLIIATSPTGAAVGDDLIFVLGDGTSLTMNDCVVTALPATSATYTGIGDIPAGLLDGSALYDAANVQTLDNGIFVGAAGNTNVQLALNNTVVTQQGTTTTPDGMVLFTGSSTFINAGSVISANARLGIQVAANTANLTVNGTIGDPVLFLNHTEATNGDAIRPFGANGPTLSINHAIFNGNTRGVNVFAGASLDLATLSFTNSVFSNNGTGLIIGDDGTGTSTALISDCTFYANTTGLQVDAAFAPRVLNITDCIFAGAGTGIIADNTVTVQLNTSALVTAAPDALTTPITNGAGIVQTPTAVSGDPEFNLTAYTFGVSRNLPDLYLAVGATAYQTAGSGGFPLTGGSISSAAAATDWQLFE